jgi:hypothetical protein
MCGLATCMKIFGMTIEKLDAGKKLNKPFGFV